MKSRLEVLRAERNQFLASLPLLRWAWLDFAQPPLEESALAVGPHERLAPGGRVVFVEDQIDHGQHGVEPGGHVVRAWHPVRNAGVTNLALGAHQPLRHRRGRNEERARDLVRLEAAQRSERQRGSQDVRQEEAVGRVSDQSAATVIVMRAASEIECLRDELDIDSMDFLRFVVRIEERPGVSVPEADDPRILSAVVDAAEPASLARKVARLEPLVCLKG